MISPELEALIRYRLEQAEAFVAEVKTHFSFPP